MRWLIHVDLNIVRPAPKRRWSYYALSGLFGQYVSCVVLTDYLHKLHIWNSTHAAAANEYDFGVLERRKYYSIRVIWIVTHCLPGQKDCM